MQTRQAMFEMIQLFIGVILNNAAIAWWATPFLLMGLIIRFLKWTTSRATGQKDVDFERDFEQIGNYRSVIKERGQQIKSRFGGSSSGRRRWMWVLPLLGALVLRGTPISYAQTGPSSDHSCTPGMSELFTGDGFTSQSFSQTLPASVIAIRVASFDDNGSYQQTFSIGGVLFNSQPVADQGDENWYRGFFGGQLVDYQATGGSGRLYVHLTMCIDSSITPTATSTSTPTASVTNTPSATSTPTASATSTPTVTGTPPTATPTPIHSPTPTPTMTITAIASVVALSGADVMTSATTFGQALPGIFWQGNGYGNMFWALGSLIIFFGVMGFVGAFVRSRWGE